MKFIPHRAEPRVVSVGARASGFAGLLLAGLFLLGAKPLHPYRTPAGITSILALGAHAGDCNECHSVHGQGDIAYDHALLGPDDNTLCDRCHTTPWAGGSYPGRWLYLGSSHGSSGGAVWPVLPHYPYRKAGEAGAVEARLVVALPFSPEQPRYELKLQVL